MSFIKLMINTENLHFNIEFDRRIIFIKGDSATGKSTFVNLLNEKIDGVDIESTLPYVVVSETTWESIMKNESDKIIIFDDLSVVESPKFASLFKNTISSNNYFIIIAREQLSKCGRLSFSSNDIYKLVSNKGYYNLERLYDYPEVCISKENTKCLLTEDTTSGFEFFKRLTDIPTVPSTNGKSTIVKDIKRLSKEYDKIFVLFDTSAFGCHMEEFDAVLSELNVDVYFLDYLECFEELLLRTNLLNNIEDVKKEMSNIPNYANNFLSWERYFEYLITKVTNRKLYYYNHDISKLPSCYTEPCDLCNINKKAKCDSILSGDKFMGLLKGTKYECLLNLR